MKTRLLYCLVLSALMCAVFAGGVRADFDQVGKIPAPLSMCGTPRYVMGLASDGSNLFVATDCMGGSYVYLISPGTGAILAASEFNGDIPGYPNDHPHLRSAAYDYDTGYYWIGDKPRELIALTWLDATSIEVMSSFSASAIQMPTGLVYGGDGVLFVLNKVESTLVRMGTDGAVLDAYDLPAIPNPTGLAAYGDNLFVLSRDDAVMYEITKQAALVEVHSFGDAFDGCCDGDAPCLHAATFHEDLLYVGSNADSICIFAFSGIVIPEGDSVAVGIPGEIELTFESVTDSGMLYVDETQVEDPCPAPPGVQLYPEFYEVNTSAFFDFLVEVALIDTSLPPTVPPERIRVFTRPSGPCGMWRDATVEYVEEVETFAINRRSRSEDDEFSWFAIADDMRSPAEVVGVKFGYLRGHIESGQDSIPADVLPQVFAALDAAELAYCRGLLLVAEALLGDMEAIIRNTPAIPHTYDPDNPGTNLAGRIVSRAHTLAFSLRYSNDEAMMSTAVVDPQLIRAGVPGLLISATVEVPEGLDPFTVDAACVYMEGLAKCIPGSLGVADFDDDGDPEIRAVFRQGDVEEAFDESGPATAWITCFIEGYEVRAMADVEVVLPVVQVAVEPQLSGGSTYPVTWEAFDCESMHPFALSFSADGGLTWVIVSAFIEGQYYDWLVPNISTDDGVLKVTCVDRQGVEQNIYSGLLLITVSAGVDDVPAGFRLALSPNPATAGLAVEFSSPKAQEVALDVYSVKGELVKTLFRGRVDQGVERLNWQGDNQAGRRVSPGTYFVVYKGETRTLTEKVVIQR